MAERSEPPKFGNWESGDVQYTDYFEKASKGRSGGKLKPNDPIATNSSSPQCEEQKVQHGGGVGPGIPKGPLETLKSGLEEGEVMRRGNDAVGCKAATVYSPHHHHWHGGISSTSVDGLKQATRMTTGSDRSIEQSPLHHQQARVVNRGSGGVSSPSWERKGGSAESGHAVPPTTPGRSRLRSSVTRDETLDDGGPTVPKFGDWDENDPALGEGFTQVFERVRDEKNSAGKVPLTPTGSSNGQKRRDGTETSKGYFCFPWGRK